MLRIQRNHSGIFAMMDLFTSETGPGRESWIGAPDVNFR
jgi:hypothetical protein